MKKDVTIFKVVRIDSKYVFIINIENKNSEIRIPKYRMPLEISVGTKLILNDYEMYEIYQEKNEKKIHETILRNSLCKLLLIFSFCLICKNCN